MKQHPEILAAHAIYFAGFFDGEGSILIYTRKSPMTNGALTPGQNLRITITNTHEGVIRWVHATFGGNVWTYRRMPPGPRRSRAWKWTAGSTLAVHILRAMLPYLIVKREQAEVALAFQEHVSGYLQQSYGKGVRRGRPRMPQDVLQLRHAMAARLQELRAQDRQQY